jgi:hypothetical protein
MEQMSPRRQAGASAPKSGRHLKLIGKAPIDLYERLDIPRPANLPPVKHSLFYSLCDRLADFIADCAEKPGTALALLSIGQLTVIVPAIIWAVL